MRNQPIEQYPVMSPSDVRSAIDAAIVQVGASLGRVGENFKHIFSTDGFYETSENDQWTNGFWTGILWFAWQLEQDPLFLKTAMAHVQSFRTRIDERIAVDTHDLGFLYSLSCVAAYKLTGDEFAKETALMAADLLAARFHAKGSFIQAWGAIDKADNYRLIIDCLLNLPLLYWASDVSGNDEYRKKAQAHIETAMDVLLRPDGSTYHTYYFDPDTGEPTKGVTHQGYSADSAWARGQAWGVYGLALSYRYTKKSEYLHLFDVVTQYFLDNLPENLIPYWDFVFNDPSDEMRDSSALAIAICGLLEMIPLLDGPQAARYEAISSRLMKALYTHCAATDPSKSDGLLLHGVYGIKTPFNDCKNHGVDECNLWGDYFYLEALMRMNGSWVSFW